MDYYLNSKKEVNFIIQKDFNPIKRRLFSLPAPLGNDVFSKTYKGKSSRKRSND